MNDGARIWRSSVPARKVAKKPRPWTRADLEDLRLEAASGAGSGLFIYLAEMGEEVSRMEQRKRTTKIVAIIAAVVAAGARLSWLWHVYCAGDIEEA